MKISRSVELSGENFSRLSSAGGIEQPTIFPAPLNADKNAYGKVNKFGGLWAGH
jgi:hypothetical protein